MVLQGNQNTVTQTWRSGWISAGFRWPSDHWINGDWLEIWPNGFSVEPLGKETLSFELTNDTTFTFVDTGFLFLDDSYMNRTYHTRVVDEFLLHRGDSNTILFVQVQNGRVISVVEELLFTQ